MDKVCPKSNSKYGAPMGRRSADIEERPTDKRVYDRYLPMCSCCGAYDKGGAYWGAALHGVKRMRVEFTEDLSYIRFYREH